jgi:uncharacterized protein (UPF0147 family)
MAERIVVFPIELNQALDETASSCVGQCLTDLEEIGVDNGVKVNVRRSMFNMLDQIKRKINEVRE